jgi:hypothetical protein
MRASSTKYGWLIGILAWALFLTAPALADEPLVYATIQPTQITLGESANFTITNLGDGTVPITLPVVSGLRFEIIGRTHQIELINGTTLPSSSIIVRVTPQIAGIFTIPGVTPKSQPVVLQVNAVPSQSSAQSGASGPNPRPPILSGGSIPKGVHLTQDGSAYLRLSVPNREIYVGESIPVEIELGARPGFVTSLNGLPRLTGDEFTLNDLSHQPERTEKIIDGQRFVSLTWRSVLAVVKPGVYSLVAEAPLTVKIRTRPREESSLDDRFGDPFWRNLFGATVQKDIKVASPQSELKVLALPTEGRPADFHGAIGTFNIESDISPLKADVGDPLTLRMRVAGSGNFDRVESNMLEHVDQWKTYPPKSTFTTSDPIRRKGEKTFEQPLIALKPGVQALPGLTFSYFDPNTQRYETARSAPISVTITPSLADRTPSESKTPADPTASGEKYARGLRPDHVVDGAIANSLIPLYLQPPFLAIPALLTLAFVGGWLTARRRKDSSARPSMRYRAASKATKRVLAQMERAARSGDEAAFFNSARSALQRSLAERWQVLPEQVTMAEIDSLGTEGEDLRQLFALADESKYSGHGLSNVNFPRWMEFVRQQLMEEKA